jgi:hypothetical protein
MMASRAFRVAFATGRESEQELPEQGESLHPDHQNKGWQPDESRFGLPSGEMPALRLFLGFGFDRAREFDG